MIRDPRPIPLPPRSAPLAFPRAKRYTTPMSATPPPHVLEHMKHMFEYSPAGMGALIWRHGRYRGELAGTPMGKYGDWRVRLDGVSYSCAKIIWLLETGSWPEFRLLHINKDREDIRFSNLEESYRRDGRGR